MLLNSRRVQLVRAILSAIIVICSSVFSQTGSAAIERESSTRPTNVILCFVDDLGWTDLGCYGSSFYETPHVDRLAREGTLFTAAYSAAPVCSPSRAAVLTGKYPPRVQFTGHITSIGRHRYPEHGRIIPPRDRMFLAHEEISLAEALKPKRYASASIGKWHLGGEGYWPRSQGFDLNVAGWTSGSPPSYFYPYKKDSDWNPSIPTLEGGKPGEYLTDRLTNEAIRFVEANRDRPFFLYLPFYSVHTPLEAPKDLVEKYTRKLETDPSQKNATYAAMVDRVDTSLGRILETLERLGLEENTAVIFTSDNGGLSSSTRNAPLREGKGYLYEGGIRVPLIVRWPGKAIAGSRRTEPVMGIDLYPTILEMVGAGQPDGGVDGKSLVPLLEGEEWDGSRPLYWYYPHYSPQAKRPGAAIRSGDYKLIDHYDPPRVELYNLAEDIGEENNLADKLPAKRAELHASLNAWLKSIDDVVLHTSNPAYQPPREPSTPNIVFIMTDDQAPWALGAAGNRDAHTPNLDRLAREGARLTNCFVTTPVCSPSRAGLMTGRYSTEVNILDYIPRRPTSFADGLDPRVPTWPKLLSGAGYATALIGKWHLGRDDKYHPSRFGYDEFAGFLHGGLVSKDPEVVVGREKKTVRGYTPDVLTDFAIDFIRRKKSKPFLVSLHYWAPHANAKRPGDQDRTWLPVSEADWKHVKDLDPRVPQPNYPKLDTPRVKRFMREYLASVAGVDRNVGRLLLELESLGLENNTVVVFTSDHGYNLGHNGIWHKGNGRRILTDDRGSRPNLYDNSLRVPALVRWPGVVPAGSLVEKTVTNIDWFPTLLAMASVASRPDTRGRNFLPLLKGEKRAWDNDLFAQYSMRHDVHADLRAYRTPRWKLVRDFLREGVDELYDLENDPGETRNLIDSTAPGIQKRRRRLGTELVKRMKQIDDPLLEKQDFHR